MFGHEKGAFTGAVKQTIGKVEMASGGTLFLDEIGDMPLALQAKLLRFLQDHVIERVGGRQEIPVDVRVVCATNKNLKQLIAEQRFRQDLYFRIGEVTIERAAAARAPWRADRARARDVAQVRRHARPAEARLHRRRDRGARGVRLAGQRARAREQGQDGDDHGRRLPASPPKIWASRKAVDGVLLFNLKEVRTRAERQAIQQALAITDDNVSRTAELLGVSRPTLYDLMEKYGMRIQGSLRCRGRPDPAAPVEAVQ